jgi:Fe(3+) dicitrate transport protein
MEGVEVLKGSSQIKYGPYTTGGAINLISTRIPDALAGRIRLWGGSHGTRNMHAWVGNRHEHVSYLVETFQFGSDGFKQLDGAATLVLPGLTTWSNWGCIPVRMPGSFSPLP